MSSTIDLYDVIVHETERDDPEPAFFYHSDHLVSAAYLTNDAGQVTQTLNYLPYGEDWVDIQNYTETRYPRLGQYTFTGKERDEETGYGYFGARYMDHELTTMWLSVDPMSDKYPSISPYAYCAWNPVRLIDPDGREIGDYYDTKGNYLGWDGNNDNNVYIVGNRADKKRIKNNDKEGRTTSVADLQSEPLLKTTYGVLREACDVLDRAEKNSGQTQKECSVVDYKSGLGVSSPTGESQSASLPQTPDWVIDAVSIHSHNKFNDATQMSGHRADNNGDAVKGKDGLHEVVETDGLDERFPVIVYFGFSPFGNLFAEGLRQSLVDAVRPVPRAAGPLLYAFSLLRSAFDLPFEVVAIRCNSAIWLSFCSREQGCSDMRCTSRCAAMLFER